jgi:hypothetical protein
MGSSAAVAAVLAALATTLWVAARRIGTEVDTTYAAVERLRLVRQAIDAVVAAARETREAADLTGDAVGQRGRR